MSEEKKAEQNFREFLHRQPTKKAELDKKIFDGEPVFIGMAKRIRYRAQKDFLDGTPDIMKIHNHPYKGPVAVFTNEQRNAIFIFPNRIDRDGIKN